MSATDPQDKWHRAGWDSRDADLPDGTYELCGEKVQGNPEGFIGHFLVLHGKATDPCFPREFEAMKEHFRNAQIEGVVWHHPDGRMVKIKKRDFWGKR